MTVVLRMYCWVYQGKNFHSLLIISNICSFFKLLLLFVISQLYHLWRIKIFISDEAADQESLTWLQLVEVWLFSEERKKERKKERETDFHELFTECWDIDAGFLKFGGKWVSISSDSPPTWVFECLIAKCEFLTHSKFVGGRCPGNSPLTVFWLGKHPFHSVTPCNEVMKFRILLFK